MEREAFDGEKLSRLMEKLPKGKPRIDAYEEAIRLADQAQDAYWRLGFRSFPNKRILRNNLCLPACRILMYKRMALEI